MMLRKLKFWSGMTAFILFAVGIILAIILRDILLPDDYGVITFDTYGGLGGILYYMVMLATALAVLWMVLLFNDTDQPDVLDTRTRMLMILLYGGLSFATGLLFYTDAYYMLLVAVPIVLAFFINRRFGGTYPHSLLNTYANICSFIGLLGGYIVITYLTWDSMWLENGEEPLGPVSSDQFVSILRIIYSIYLYIIVNFIGSWIAEGRRRIPDNLSSGERSEIIRHERRHMLKVTSVLLPVILLINLVPWNGGFGLLLTAAAICYALMFMAPSILKLAALYTKRN